MKNIVTKSIGCLVALAIIITGIPVTTTVQAASKPIIKSSQVAISNNSCTIRENQKVTLTAKSGKKNITKKGKWKSSKKTVATISKKGLLTAKKAGTTHITVKYKGKTSKKLKVVVIANMTTSPEDTNTPSTPTSKPVAGAHILTYNPNGGTLNGSSTQSVAGEILNFNTTVTAPSGKTFLGWFDAETGGNRVYETNVVNSNMTLYARYTNKATQRLTFSLGCNYGDTYSFMATNTSRHSAEYDWLNQKYNSGPVQFDDEENVAWDHMYEVSDNKFTVDNLPTPEVPGYEFAGWYTTDQSYLKSVKKATKVEAGQQINTDIDGVYLYARFVKKLTISFDDLRGGKYDDIVIDSYKSIKDCGKKLPVPEIKGAKFKGWVMDASNNSASWEIARGIITEDSQFLNLIDWHGFMCSGCGAVSKYSTDDIRYCETGCDTHFNAVNDDRMVYEETDHFTLYPKYEYNDVKLSFDPKGGTFPYNVEENWMLRFPEDGDDDRAYNHTTVGTLLGNKRGSEPYGRFKFPGHDDGINDGCWSYGNNEKTMPKVKRANYTFAGWYYRDDDGVEREFTYNTILTKSMTIYAKWDAGTSYVLYYAADGTIPQSERDRVGLDGTRRYSVKTESTLRESGKDFPIPVNDDGRKFTGWFDKDGNEVTLDTKITGDITLYAQWGPLPKDLPVTINFDLNGGTVTNANFKPSVSITRGTKYNNFYTPTRDGYDFLGWYVLKPGATDYSKDTSFIGTKLGNSLSISDNMIAGLDDGNDDNDTVVIVARWKAQAHAESIYVLDDTWESIPENKTYEVKYTGAGTNVPLGFGAVVTPETIKNKMLYWSVDDNSAMTITGADSKGEYDLMSSNWFENLVFGNITPTREGKTVVLTVRSRDNADVKFSVKIHVVFDEK